MIYEVTKADRKVSGRLELTASKSESNRALIVQALCKEPFRIDNLAKAKDTQTLIELLNSKEEVKDVGPAGTTMRFLTAYCALQPGQHLLTGSDRMKQRPIGILVDALRDLGANIEYAEQEGYPPLKIQGQPLAGGVVEMDGSVSSQFISAVLLIAPVLEKGVTIRFVGEIASRPYLEMTLRMLHYFGASYRWNDNELTVDPGGYTAKDFKVEADWSAASYWYSMAALASEAEIFLGGLKKESLQGDAVIADLYQHFQVETTYGEEGISIKKQNNPNPIFLPLVYNFEDCPDVAQTLACTCAGLGCETTMSGLKSLRIKETDRSLALKTELGKYGFQSELQGDEAFILSKGNLEHQPDTVIATYEDHRMAMAFAPLALVTRHLKIADPQVVDKSYPAFWDDLRAVGFEINEIELN